MFGCVSDHVCLCVFCSEPIREAAAELQRLSAGLLLPDGKTAGGVLPLPRRLDFLLLLLLLAVAHLRGPDTEER